MLEGVDRTAAITVHHLLTHTSGLPDYFDKPNRGPSLYEQLACCAPSPVDDLAGVGSGRHGCAAHPSGKTGS